ncbi:helix-turn-helix domain-containing protein [Polyangium sorediatum]|uniref:Helix-turn-helix transcriptional regulator n=1 Tax=Polyangium sorediatum TaxID=889274 RepID=A0ABT6NTP0_9BACT|nr:helix-turn-helix transcriptional regulator [Polyangium sorediatum]MDI1431656.1 helix-turn-helix transcriptional regulator [Polyangium sorediatum]
MQQRVRGALVAYAQGKAQHAVAQALGYPRGYVAAVFEGKLHVTVHFAGQVARVLGTDVNARAGGAAQVGVGEAAAGASEGAEAPPKV